MNYALQLLACAVGLGLIHISLAAFVSVKARGLPWAIGPRDEPGEPLPNMSARIARASSNFLESFPLFAAVILAGVALGKSDAQTLGAELYLWARVAYLPLYVAAVPFTRTVAWTVAMIGILLALIPLFG